MWHLFGVASDADDDDEEDEDDGDDDDVAPKWLRTLVTRARAELVAPHRGAVDGAPGLSWSPGAVDASRCLQPPVVAPPPGGR